MNNGRFATLLLASLACTGLSLPHSSEARPARTPPHSPRIAKPAAGADTAAHKPAATEKPLRRLTTHVGASHLQLAAQVGGKANRRRNRFICSYPIDVSGTTQHGVAVFYGVGKGAFRTTASGEALDPHAMTAASPTLPIGSQADVTNLRTGLTMRVRINDRGPYGPGLKLDVTPAVAEQLGMMDSGRDEVEIQPVKETLN